MISRLKRPGLLTAILHKALGLPFLGRVRQRIKTSGAVRFINASGLFDRGWYLQRYPDVAESGIDPTLHYVCFGVADARDPHPLFDTSYYLERYPDVEASGLNPFEHYLHSGAGEGRSPHPLFDTSFYLQRNPDVAEAGIDPFLHFLLKGGLESRCPHPLFDTGYYLQKNPHLIESGRNPLVDFVTIGHLRGRNPHPLFDTDFYRQTNPDVANTGENSLVHFLRCGASEGRNPHPLFDLAHYRECLPETQVSDPLLHYLASGVEGRPSPHPLFDVPFYLEQHPELAEANVDPLVHYLEVGADEGSDPHPLFRTSYYLVNNSDVAVLSVNPLVHFVVTGAAEGRDPSPLFDSRYYLSRYPDVDSQNPLVFFLRHGLERVQSPHPLFDTAFYLQNNPEVVTLGVNPLEHFVTTGWTAGCNPHPLFDLSYYLRCSSEVVAANENPLEHYLRKGAAAFLDPHPLVDTRYIVEQSTEAQSSPLTPLVYYLEEWSAQGLDPHPLFDTAYYFEKNSDLKKDDTQPLIHYVTTGAREGRNPSPWFDRDYYERCYSRALDEDPLIHFITFGAKEGLNPSADFNTSFYLEEHPEVAEVGMNPLAHYVLFGKDEQRSIAPTLPRMWSKGLVVFSATAYLGGANQIALALVREVAIHHPDLRVSTVLCCGGPLEKQFARYSQVMNLERLTAEHGGRERALERVIEILQSRQIYSAILNTVITGELAGRLKESGFEVVGLIHELATSIDVFEWADEAEGHAMFSDRIVFPAQVVRESFCRRFSVLRGKTRIHSQGLLRPNPYLDDKGAARSWVRSSLGIPGKARIVLGCGYADLRKGLDIFRDIAQIVCGSPETADVHFVWLGDGDDVACGWFRHDLEKSSLKGRVHFLGHVDDPYRYFAGADVFLLTSREDPFPTVNLEAMEAGLAVVAFRGAGGAEEILAEGCGVLVPYGDVYEMACETIRLLLDEDELQSIGEKASQKIAETQSLIDYVRFLRSLFGNLPSPGIAASSPRLPAQPVHETRLNVLVVIGDFEVGGGQMFAIRLANALSEQCNVFCANARPELVHPEVTALFGHDVRILDSHGDPGNLARLIGEHDIDVVNSHIWWADKLSFLALKESSIPWFVTMHGCYEHLLDHEATDPAFPRIARELLLRTDGILYPADKNLRVFGALDLPHEEKAEKIYYGLDSSEYRTSAQPVEMDFGEEAFVVGIVSRAMAKKGWEQAAQATLQINADRRPGQKTVHLVLVGESDYSQELKRKYQEESTIHFVGHSKRPASWIATFDVGLLPTYFESESLPNTVIEYLACGKPTIATAIGEIPHMIADGETAAGTLIDLTDAGLPNVDQLRRAILEYMGDEGLLRSHAENTSRLFRQFSIHACAERYVRAFSNAVKRRSARTQHTRSGISVVIPLYNHERYIAAAVESVLAQRVPADEIIIIDDGSKDRSARIARTLAREHPEIRFWSRSNQGAHATINEGIAAARGEYVAILNSDDLFHPDRFTECLAAMQSDAGPEVVFSRVVFVTDDNRPFQLSWYEDAVRSWQEGEDFLNYHLPLALLRCNFFLTTSNLFARKSVFDRVGGFANLRYAHDLDFFIRLLTAHVPITFLDQPLVRYRQHEANTIQENPSQMQTELGAISAFYAESYWRSLPEKGLDGFYSIHHIAESSFHNHAFPQFLRFLALASEIEELQNSAQLVEAVGPPPRSPHQSKLEQLFADGERSDVGLDRLVRFATGFNAWGTEGLPLRSGQGPKPDEIEAVRAMPIVFSTPYWGISGVNVVLETLVRHLQAKGFNPLLLISKRPEDHQVDSRPDVPHHFLECGANTYVERWKAMAEFFDCRKPCIWVPGFDFDMSSISATLPSEVGIVGMIQSDDPMHYEHVNRVGRYWNAIVTVSRYLKEQVEAINPLFAPAIHLVHNAVDVPDEDQISEQRSDGPLGIITAGRLEHYQKRVRDIPGIAQALDRRGVDYHLTLVGDGEERQALEEALTPQIRAGRVSMPGRLSPEQVGEAYSKSSVFLLCSAFEGMPLALLEGMARGLVPVVSDVKSGVPEAVHDGENGFIVPIGDVEAFADRIAGLQERPALRAKMAKAARATVVDGGFDSATMASGYARVFLKVGIEILRGEYTRPETFLPQAEFGRILLPPWLQAHPDYTMNPGQSGL